jgi:hypothetical protein
MLLEIFEKANNNEDINDVRLGYALFIRTLKHAVITFKKK